MQVVSVVFIVDHAEFLPVPAHEDVNVTVVRVTAKAAVDYLKYPGCLAAHVGELRHVVEVPQS